MPLVYAKIEASRDEKFEDANVHDFVQKIIFIFGNLVNFFFRIFLKCEMFKSAKVTWYGYQPQLEKILRQMAVKTKFENLNFYRFLTVYMPFSHFCEYPGPTTLKTHYLTRN
jgi:hypothetical protein